MINSMAIAVMFKRIILALALSFPIKTTLIEQCCRADSTKLSLHAIVEFVEMFEKGFEQVQTMRQIGNAHHLATTVHR